MKIPYFKVTQFDRSYFVTRMNASYLLDKVDFEFRFPYKNNPRDIYDANKYIKDLEKLTGVQVEEEHQDKAIQRRTDLKRIQNISQFIKNHPRESLLFTTPLVLGVNVYDDNGTENVQESDNNLVISDSARFTIIDGQHRLLGIANYISDNAHDDSIELPIILLADIDLAEATKIFIDINSNQKKVNRSIVYDLYSNIDESIFEKERDIKTVVQALNENSSSLLYQKVKMLGTGSGSISLAFMIDYISGEILGNVSEFNKKKLMISLNNYFRILSLSFPNDWNNFLKTTGMGAALMFYKYFIEITNDQPVTTESLIYGYLSENINSKLKDYLTTVDIDFGKVQGTGKKAQKTILSQLQEGKTPKL